MSEHRHYTIGELQDLIGRGLGEAHPLPYWVAGEVSDAKLHVKSGHFYFDLVEKGGDKSVPTAMIRASIWKSNYGRIMDYFCHITGSAIADGMKIMVKCRVNYHEFYGLSLVVMDIEPSYTLGEIEHQRQETIRRLTEENVLEMNRALGFPMVVQSVAIISSETAAGYQDFVNEILAGGYAFRITLFDAFMQGDAAEESIIAAFDLIAAREGDFDAVILIRGGGSQSDLGCFNSYRLCYYMTQFPLPIVTGIGHDKDNSVADLVAAHFLKTPTAVAGYLNAQMAAFEEKLDSMSGDMAASAQAVVTAAKERLRRLVGEMQFRATGRLGSGVDRLERLKLKLNLTSRASVKEEAATLGDLSANVRDAARQCVVNGKSYVRHRESLVAAYDPARILERGYSIVRRNGAVLKDVSEVAPGDGIEIESRNNFIEATVNKIR